LTEEFLPDDSGRGNQVEDLISGIQLQGARGLEGELKAGLLCARDRVLVRI